MMSGPEPTIFVYVLQCLILDVRSCWSSATHPPQTIQFTHPCVLSKCPRQSHWLLSNGSSRKSLGRDYPWENGGMQAPPALKFHCLH
ncbi:hypothetical protein GDO81_003646 [Engystomops pustulosus]|uniref:Secreted protein n=1 Tax=Engystomops pustulosus TaxID=76066 RepID=A0AAV6ZZX3_ENGPU|nr:hypothetical protein GDO81_003646 [Engystomops pustulosus]